MFWFFNNGITIVCDRCDVVDDPDTPHLKLTNLQIVNGCQTSMTLATALERRLLQQNVEVLVKVFETNNNRFVGKVVLTTNNQNAISSRDLKANDRIQEDYQRAFLKLYGIRYERKPREYKGLSREEGRTVISNEKVGQAFLAIVKKKPTISRTQKYRLWEDEIYRDVFPETTIEKHLLAYLIYDYCLSAKKDALSQWKDDDIRYSVVSYGVFHLARVLAFKYTSIESWDNPQKTEQWIHEIQKTPSILKRHYKTSVTMIRQLIKEKPQWQENINNVFKASDIEIAINKRLH
jgi:AIPR protein